MEAVVSQRCFIRSLGLNIISYADGSGKYLLYLFSPGQSMSAVRLKKVQEMFSFLFLVLAVGVKVTPLFVMVFCWRQ